MFYKSAFWAIFSLPNAFILTPFIVKSFRKAGVDWKSTYFILKITHLGRYLEVQRFAKPPPKFSLCTDCPFPQEKSGDGRVMGAVHRLPKFKFV